MEKILSIVTITYNNFQELYDTISSVPIDNRVEHCVINGGSCGLTASFLLNSKFSYISEPDEGISDAFNKGISLSSSPYILFLNSGDKIHDKKNLLEILSLIESNMEVDIFSASIQFTNANKDIVSPRISELGKPWLGMPLPHPGMITSRTLFIKDCKFSKEFKTSMDLEWLTNVFIKLKKLNILNVDYIILSEMNADGISNNKPFLVLFETLWIMFKYTAFRLDGYIYLSLRFIYSMLLKSKSDFIIKTTKKLRMIFK